MRPAEKFLFAVVILFILLLLFQFLGAFMAGWIYGFSFTEILSIQDFDDPTYVAASKLMQILGSIGTFIVPAFLFSYLFAGDLFSYYGFRKPVGTAALLFTVMMIVSVIPFINYTAELNMRMEIPIKALDRILRTLEGEAEEMMVAFTATRSIWGLLVNLLMIGVIACRGRGANFQRSASAADDRHDKECARGHCDYGHPIQCLSFSVFFLPSPFRTGTGSGIPDVLWPLHLVSHSCSFREQCHGGDLLLFQFKGKCRRYAGGDWNKHHDPGGCSYQPGAISFLCPIVVLSR